MIALICPKHTRERLGYFYIPSVHHHLMMMRLDTYCPECKKEDEEAMHMIKVEPLPPMHRCDPCGRMTRNRVQFETRLLLCDRCAKLYKPRGAWRQCVQLEDGTYLFIERVLKDAPEEIEWMG